MRIAYLTDTYLPEINGVVTSIHNFTENLAERGHEILIIAPKYNRKHDNTQENITIKRYPSFSFASNKETRVAYPYIIGILRDLREFKPDIIHIQTPLSIGAVGILAAKILGIKSIQTYHTYIPDFMVYLNPYNILGLSKLKDAIASSKVMLKIVDSDSFRLLGGVAEDIKKRSEIITTINKLARRIRGNREKTFTEKFAWDYTRFLYSKSDVVLTPSIALAKLLKKHRVNPIVYDMSNGIEFHFFDKKRNYSIQNKMIHIGRLGLEKGTDEVVKAFAIALKSNPKLTLDIYGEGPAKAGLVELVKKLNIGDNINFWGFVSRAEIKKALKNHDFFVTASTIETQGLVILEAMAAGLPVLGVNALAVPELVNNGVNGYLVEPHNLKQLAEAMLKLTENKERNKNFGEKSIMMAEKHDLSNCVDKLENIYAELIC